jgi:tetratricopeptide (TPR) repeat protein
MTMCRCSGSKISIPFREKIALILFGVALFFVILEIILRLAGFLLVSIQGYRNYLSAREKDAYRIVCIGESTTALGQEDSYPSKLEGILNQHKTGIRFSVINKGMVGVTSGDIVLKLDAFLDEYHPDMVIAMMGINDAGPHMPLDEGSWLDAVMGSLRIFRLAKLLWLHKITPGTVVPEKQQVSVQQAKQSCQDLEECLKAVGTSPQEWGTYLELGQYYFSHGRLSEAEEAFKKTVELDPGRAGLCLNLGCFYQVRNKFPEAESWLNKALELDPTNEMVHIVLGRLYFSQGKYPAAEQFLSKAIAMNPANEDTYIDLSWAYRMQGKFSEGYALLRRGLSVIPGRQRLYAALAMVCLEMGKRSLYQRYDRMAQKLREGSFNLMTIRSYQTLKEKLDARGIRLVCVQYPMRSIACLKKVFEGQKGIVFVDNEKSFKNAVAQSGYRQYFADMFGGDFGHCTSYGNELLARNIAEVILKEVF